MMMPLQQAESIMCIIRQNFIHKDCFEKPAMEKP